jgi:hypothetical protein
MHWAFGDLSNVIDVKLAIFTFTGICRPAELKYLTVCCFALILNLIFFYCFVAFRCREAFLRFSTLISALNPSTDGTTPDGDVERYVLGFKVGRNYRIFHCLLLFLPREKRRISSH